MIVRKDILTIPFFKKSPFTGSYQGMRYRIEKKEKEEETPVLLASVWEGPYSFAVTPKENLLCREFPFSEEGICETVDWLNACWEQERERWAVACRNW